MRWVIVYDIADDRLRDRIAALLGRFGWRVQESVFECVLDVRTLPALTAAVGREIGRAAVAEVRFYQTCQSCRGQSLRIGRARTERPDERACDVF